MMRIILLCGFVFFVAENASAQSASEAKAGTDYLSKPGIAVRKGPTCQCPKEVEKDVLALIGIVVDAEMTLADDGISVNDRQATIFNINPSTANDYKGRTKIWHSSNKAQCGMAFSYGVKYRLTVRKIQDGTLETDSCLMKPAVK